MKNGLLKMNQESFRSGKLTSDPKIVSDGFCTLIRSDELSNQSQVTMSANEKGSDLENQMVHLEIKTAVYEKSIAQYVKSALSSSHKTSDMVSEKGGITGSNRVMQWLIIQN